jgi:mono/diheme cytochrome c family protein
MARRSLFWLLTVTVVCAAASSLVATGAQQPPRGFVNQYCVGCHNDRTKTGGLALDTIDVENVGANPEIWEKALRKLHARTMPPAGSPRPDERAYDNFATYLETALDRLAGANPNPGPTVTFRRLNRTEYRNVIRDLLALDVDVESLLPPDEANYGFDNVGNAGLSPTLMERYLAAAQRISRLAIGNPGRSPGGATFVVPPDLTQDRHIEGLPFGTRGGTVVRHNFPLDGDYEVEIRLALNVDDHIQGLTEPHQLELMLDGERVEVFKVEPATGGPANSVDRERDEGIFKRRVPVKAGPHDLGVAFIKRPSARAETERQPYQSSFGDRHPRTQPALHSVSVLGPFEPGAAGNTPSRQRIFVCRPSGASAEAGCAKTIISRLARLAYRRQVTDTDLAVPLDFYEQGRARAGFETGIELALRALLISPQFLFRIEQAPRGNAPNAPYRVSDVNLASRLSFFLWSSMPDEELLTEAINGRLGRPAILEQQVKRMLADPRSDALVSSFGGQWLYLRNLAEVKPDPRLFTDFDDNLRQAFRRETELFFGSIINEDRSVLELLSANYTFLNERLAKHYRVPNVYGSHFRRVTLGEDSGRGGLLGHGSILTVTSYATRTSPVLRGKWILENVLGAPPPPPPANVPPLEDNKSNGRVLSMRERMIQHRANPACASCHRVMDPLGLSMENFDAIGRWRTQDDTRRPIDASGGLPNGAGFAGMGGLRKALLERPELFVTTMTEKLLTYALGRGLEHYDAPAVRAIVRNARKNDYRFSSLVHGIVNSTPFQIRRPS